MNNELTGINSIIIPINKLDKTELASQKDHTYTLISDEVVSNIKVIQSIFVGSIIRKSTFNNVDFSICDFEGTKFEYCTFNSCNFSNIDMKSCIISETHFNECNFNNALIDDISVNGGGYCKSSFEQASTTDSNFTNVFFKNNITSHSTTSSNKYSKCIFEQIKMGNCSFAPNIMLNCTFIKCAFNFDSLGYLYGLTLADISKNDLIFLGEEIRFDKNDLVNEVEELYLSKKWFFQFALFKLNIDNNNKFQPLIEAMTALAGYLKSDLIVKKEDIKYIAKLYKEFYAANELPYGSVIYARNIINAILTIDNNAVNKIESTLLDFIEDLNMYYFAFNELENNIAFCFVNPSLSITLEAIYNEKPSIEPAELMNKLNRCIGDDADNTKLLSSRSGSYIATIYTTLATLGGFMMMLYLIRGNINQMTLLISELEVLFNSHKRREYEKYAKKPKDMMDKKVIEIAKYLFSLQKLDKETLYSIINDSSLLKEVKIDKKQAS